MQGRNAGRPKNAEISLNRVEAAAPPSTPDRPASAAGRKIHYAGRVIRKSRHVRCDLHVGFFCVAAFQTEKEKGTKETCLYYGFRQDDTPEKVQCRFVYQNLRQHVTCGQTAHHFNF